MRIARRRSPPRPGTSTCRPASPSRPASPKHSMSSPLRHRSMSSITGASRGESTSARAPLCSASLPSRAAVHVDVAADHRARGERAPRGQGMRVRLPRRHVAEDVDRRELDAGERAVPRRRPVSPPIAYTKREAAVALTAAAASARRACASCGARRGSAPGSRTSWSRRWQRSRSSCRRRSARARRTPSPRRGRCRRRWRRARTGSAPSQVCAPTETDAGLARRAVRLLAGERDDRAGEARAADRQRLAGRVDDRLRRHLVDDRRRGHGGDVGIAQHADRAAVRVHDDEVVGARGRAGRHDRGERVVVDARSRPSSWIAGSLLLPAGLRNTIGVGAKASPPLRTMVTACALRPLAERGLDLARA